ncbi:MAG: shikimate kinase [Gemmatimonadota bacterium]
MSHGPVPGIDRIVLVGFMASGKSTVGRLLARRLGWSFLDFDETIRDRTGRDAGTLIRTRGEAAFRALEAELTHEAAGLTAVVLAPGGGWVTQPGLADLLGPGTVRVWLRVSAAEAVRRADAEGRDRPLLGPAAGRLERAAELIRRREPLYSAAELAVDVDGKDPEAVVEAIVRGLAPETGGE